MAYIITKYLITAAVVVAVSEIAKKSDKLGALIGSLPLMTILTLIWLYVEKQPSSKIENHAFYTFFYVLPTLPMFLIFPYIHQKFGFVISLIVSVVITFFLFLITAFLLKKINIFLL